MDGMVGGWYLLYVLIACMGLLIGGRSLPQGLLRVLRELVDDVMLDGVHSIASEQDTNVASSDAHLGVDIRISIED